MNKNIDIKLILERTILCILGVTIFLRLIIYRFFITSSEQGLGELFKAANRADMLIVIILLSAAALFLLKLVFNREPFPRTALDIPLLIFFLAAAASFPYSPDKRATLSAVIFLFANIAVFYTLAGCLNSDYRRRLFMMLLIAAGLSTSLLGIIHYFFIYDSMSTAGLVGHARHMVDIKRIGSLFGWPNLLAGFLILIIPLSFTCIFTLKERIEKFWMALTTAILVLAMFFAHSILCWACLMAGAAVFGCAFFSMKKSAPRGRMLNFALVSAAIFALAAFFFIIYKRMDPFTRTSVEARFEYYRIAFFMIKAHPFIGSGFNTFGFMSSRIASSPAGYSMYAHNIFLQLLAEAGAAGLFAFSWLIVNIIRYGSGSMLNIKTAGDRILFAGIFCAVATFLLDNLFNVTFFAPETSIFWWIFLGIMFSRGNVSERRAP